MNLNLRKISNSELYHKNLMFPLAINIQEWIIQETRTSKVHSSLCPLCRIK